MKTFDERLLEELYGIISESKVEMFERIAKERIRHISIVLENIHQEHNASAVLRTCESFGIQDLYVIEKNNKYKVQRDIARGAGKWVDLHQFNKGDNPTLECITELKTKGYKIVATTPHSEGYTIESLPLNQPIALVFGTEHTGVSTSITEHADEFVTIPMVGFTESFNISVSAAISMYALRNRLNQEVFDWKLNDKEQLDLKLKWCEKLIPRGHIVVPEIRKRLLEKD
jgi:tRNA (guanosine-2'-O-)-methyltransferase